MSKNKQYKQQQPAEPIQSVSVTPPVIELEPIQSYDGPSQMYGGISPVIGAHIATIVDYTRAMMPGTPITPPQGAMYQNRLYNALLGILSAPDIGDTIDGLDRVMALFREHSQGALNVQYTQRFIDTWMVDERTRDLFTHMCLVLSTYSNKDKRARYGLRMNISGERNVFQHMDADLRERLVQYLTRYVTDADDMVFEY